MRKAPILKNPLSDEKILTHIPFLAELASRGSISEVALHRGTTAEAVAYHLHLLKEELGPVYRTPRGGKALVTDTGWELLAAYSRLNREREVTLSCIARMRGLKPHAQCQKCFPESAKPFFGKDVFPQIKNLRRKVVIECLLCGTKVMALLRSCVQKWLNLHDADINGSHPSFKIHYVGDNPGLLLS